MTVYRLRKEGLHWREIGGEAVVVDVPESLYLGANPTGTLLWGELAQGATSDALAALLVERYGIDVDRAREDVNRFLAALQDRKLLEVVTDG
jgi:hypothetical protein